MFYTHPINRVFEIIGGARVTPEEAVRDVLYGSGYDDETVELAVLSICETPAPPAPCGYCRRCALHDDPGGCLEVERWARENPAADRAARVV